MFFNLVPDNYRQASFFCDTADEPLVKLHQVVDRLNHRHGWDKVRLAAQDYDLTWKTMQQWVSACYATRWVVISSMNQW